MLSLSEENGEVMLCWFLRFISSFRSFPPKIGALSSFDREDTKPSQDPLPMLFLGFPSWGENWQEIGALEEGRSLSTCLPLSLPWSYFWHCLFLLGLHNSWAASP